MAGHETHRSQPALDLYGWLFVASVIGLLVRVMLVPSGIMMNDEYYYAKTTYLWFLDAVHIREITSLPTRGQADFPNALFFALYRMTYLFGQNFYIGAKTLNVLLASGMALMVYRVGRAYIARGAAMAIAILVLWLPSSSYYAYFVPEPLYELLIWCGLAAYLVNVAQHPNRAVVLLGACLGAALLAKPNAAAVLIAANAVVVVVGFVHRNDERISLPACIIALALLNVSFIGTAYGLHTVLTQSFAWDPVGKFYQAGLSKLGELDAQRSFIQIFAKYSAAYLLAIAFVLGPPLVVLVTRATQRRGNVADTALVAMSLVGIAVLLLGSAKVATNWERVYVNHADIYSTRYMSVLFPLLMIGFVRFVHETHEPRVVRALMGGLLAVLVVALGIAFTHMNNTFQMREVMWPKDLVRIAYRAALGSAAAVTLYYGLRRRPGIGVYGFAIGIMALLSCGTLLRKDAIEARTGEPGRIADAARALTAMVPRADYDRGLVVAPSNHVASEFMFQFPGIDALVVTDSVHTLSRAQIPAAATWVVFLGGRNPAYLEACFPLTAATFCQLAAVAPAR